MINRGYCFFQKARFISVVQSIYEFVKFNWVGIAIFLFVAYLGFVTAEKKRELMSKNQSKKSMLQLPHRR